MKSASLLVFSVLHAVASIAAVTVTNGSVTSYDPAELLSKIFNSNPAAVDPVPIESRQRGYGFIKFEDQAGSSLDPDNQDPGQYGLVDPGQRPLRFEDDYDQQYNNEDHNSQSDRPIKFQDSEDDLSSNSGGVTFQDDNKVEDQGNKKKRKRRRRRKPKNGVLPYPGAVGLSPGRPGVAGIPGADGRPGFQGPIPAGYGQNPYPGYPGQPFRRPRRTRPKPSLATEALSSITGALTSIARYDDYQCVPRLLCEAAGDGGLGNNGVLQSIAGVQPLLTLLSAYNGISTSPLFVFGRAVFLGMTAKGNTGSCRYAYPQCPTDPEQLIYYLNNHNGGFFRFFNAPQVPNQNLEQFYNQLGNQGHGIYQPQPNPALQNYGYPNDPNSAQNYGLNQNNQNDQYPNPGAYDNQYYEQNYGHQTPGAYDRPGLYNTQNYTPNYANNYNYGSGNQIRFKDSNAKIEKRIQNKPTQNLADDIFEDDDTKTKWQFPDDQSAGVNNNNNYNIRDNQFPNDQQADVNKNYYNIRDSRTLKFPEDGQLYNDQKDSTRKGKQVHFPNNKNNQNYYNNRQHGFTNNNRYETTTYSYNNGQNNQNYYTNRPNTYTNNNNYKPAIPYHNHDYNPNNNNNKYQNHQNYYNNRQNMYNNNNKYQPNTIFNNEEYVFDHKHNFYVKKENNYSNKAHNTNSYSNNAYNTNNYSNNAYNTNNYSNNAYNTNSNAKRNGDDGIKTVYVVRGNGDPNRPEIVKLRPGQSVY